MKKLESLQQLPQRVLHFFNEKLNESALASCLHVSYFVFITACTRLCLSISLGAHCMQYVCMHIRHGWIFYHSFGIWVSSDFLYFMGADNLWLWPALLHPSFASAINAKVVNGPA